MNNTCRNQKEYIDSVKQIYRNKEFDSFKNEIRKYYANTVIKTSWMVKRLQKLSKGEKPYIDLLVFIISIVLSTVLSSCISADILKQVREVDSENQIKLTIIVILSIFLLVVVITLVTIAFTLPIAMCGISKKDIEQRKYEIHIIKSKLNKQHLLSVITQKDNKKEWWKDFVLGVLWGIILPVLATIVMMFFA